MDAAVSRFLPPTRQPDLTVWLPGPVRGKGRPRTRVVNAGGKTFATHYTDSETRSYEAMLRYAAEQAMRTAGIGKPIDEAMRCRVTAILDVPDSWARMKKSAALSGDVRPTGKPDADNILKAAADGLNGVAWTDDCRVVEFAVRKFYGEQPGLLIEVWRIAGPLL